MGSQASRLAELELRLGVHFKDQNVLLQALTHRSYLNENRDWPVGHNERLEFLGDTVINLLVADHLFRQLPTETEGVLTRTKSGLVNNVNLGKIGQELGLLEYFHGARGTRTEGKDVLQHLTACMYEAVIGAIYLDQGIKAAKNVVMRTLLGTDLTGAIGQQDPKSTLQELTQTQWSITPTYSTTQLSEITQRPARFIARVYLNDIFIAAGGGTSKKRATNAAAQEALRNRTWEKKISSLNYPKGGMNDNQEPKPGVSETLHKRGVSRIR